MESPATGLYFEGEYGAILPSLQGLSLSCREEAARANAYPNSLPNHSQSYNQSHGFLRSRATPPAIRPQQSEAVHHALDLSLHPFRIAQSVFGALPRDQHLQAPEDSLIADDRQCPLPHQHHHQQAADNLLRKSSFAHAADAGAMGAEVHLMQGLAISQHNQGADRESREGVAGATSIFTSDLRDALPSPDSSFAADMGGWGSPASHASRASSCGQSLVWGDVVVACSGDGDYADSELSFLMQQSNISDASEMSYASYIS